MAAITYTPEGIRDAIKSELQATLVMDIDQRTDHELQLDKTAINMAHAFYQKIWYAKDWWWKKSLQTLSFSVDDTVQDLSSTFDKVAGLSLMEGDETIPVNWQDDHTFGVYRAILPATGRAVVFRIINKVAASETKQIEVTSGVAVAFTMPLEYYRTAVTLGDTSSPTWPRKYDGLWYDGCLARAIAYDPDRRTESREQMKDWERRLQTTPNAEIDLSDRRARDAQHLIASLSSHRGIYS